MSPLSELHGHHSRYLGRNSLSIESQFSKASISEQRVQPMHSSSLDRSAHGPSSEGFAGAALRVIPRSLLSRAVNRPTPTDTEMSVHAASVF